jgi:hypothetical protein
VNGDLFMKPDFATMPWKELRNYVLSHKDDAEALRVFMHQRSEDNGQKYNFPLTEDGIKQMEEIFRRKVDEREII